MLRRPTTLLLLILLCTGSVSAQIVDVRPYVEDDRIKTKGFIDSGSTEVPDQRVFAYNFGEYEDPYFTQDPGFNAASGSGLPGGSQLAFNILSGLDFDLPSNLSYWSGSGAVTFGVLPSGESLLLNFGSNNRTVGSATGFQAGFNLQTVTASGSVHRHLNATLNGGSGNPAVGVYLLSLNLASSDAWIADSLPFFLLYNNGLSPQGRTDAMNWVEDNLLGALGDFDQDGDVDADDIDLLCALIDTGDPEGDVNADSVVNQDDMDHMIATILDTTYGDADLDSDVDGADFDAWRLRDSLGSPVGWATGDFDCDGDVDGADFDLWRLRPAAIAGGEPVAVPEPNAIVLLCLGAVLCIGANAPVLRRFGPLFGCISRYNGSQ